MISYIGLEISLFGVDDDDLDRVRTRIEESLSKEFGIPVTYLSVEIVESTPVDGFR